MACNLREFKEFIDNEMIVILGQMDSPTEIFDHVFLVRMQELKDDENFVVNYKKQTVKIQFKKYIITWLFPCYLRHEVY